MPNTTLDFRNETWSLNPATKGRHDIFGEGRRVWVGGDPDLLGSWDHNRSEPHEVMIPPEKCVYYWLGCEDKRAEGNYCAAHYAESLEIEGAFAESDQARLREYRRVRKAEYRSRVRKRPSRASSQREYYGRHKDKINEAKREARQAGVHVP